MSYAPSNAIGGVNVLAEDLHIGVYEVAGLGEFICLVHKTGGDYRAADQTPISESAIEGHGGMVNFRKYLVTAYRRWMAAHYKKKLNPEWQELVHSFTLGEIRG